MKLLISERDLTALAHQTSFSFTELQQAALVMGADEPDLTLEIYRRFVEECVASGASPYSLALTRSCP